MKPLFGQAVKYLEIIVLLAIVASTSFLIVEKGLVHKRTLQEKRAFLEREHKELTTDVRALERRLRSLRDDPRAVEKAAKCKLGMARPEEIVYIFDRGNQVVEQHSSGLSLVKGNNKR
ncbi:MAG: septum formation initiator family protein [Desulfomonile sp.]|nr:septum formation initiator family protein [Desulfomonile sp.]